MSKIGDKVALGEEHHFTRGAEIAARDKQADQRSPTAFKQIGPGDNPGINVASKSMKRKTSSGNKFSNAV